MKKRFLFCLPVFSILLIAGCIDSEPVISPENLGWFGDDDMGSIQTNVIYFGNTGNLPAKYDLTNKFPPVGDQGRYGTCVAWSVGYNYKTALNAIDQNYSSSQLANPAFQFSPKDLFVSIPDAKKGPECGGTNFESALSQVQARGIATLQTVPYTNLSDCGSYNGNASWDNEAAGNKIKYWRKVEAKTPEDIKALIADNIPVMFGARLSDNFMTWNSDAVLSAQSSYNNVGQHAYHALVISGYDDSKQAFKVVNSWGKSWGSAGYIWIDYSFLLNEFCLNSLGERSLFIAVNAGGSVNPPTDPDPQVSGTDLAAWVFGDYPDGFYQGYPKRVSTFNIYNIGNQTVSAAKEWSVYCIAFNAYDADDYGVLFSCTVNQSVPYATEYCTDFNTCTYNADIAAGGDFAEAFGLTYFGFAYTMPKVTGYYYLVLYVDLFDVYNESDETNNIFYPFFDPIYFVNGQGFSSGGADDRSAEAANTFYFTNGEHPGPVQLKGSAHHTLVHHDLNAYRSSEFAAVIRRSKENGTFQRKLAEMVARNKK
jgi:hypothetical protein